VKMSPWSSIRKRNAGFTLIEVIVIVAILAILAGILAPMIFSQIDDAKLARAEADAKSISSASFVFRKDIGRWPNWDNACSPNATLVVGTGNLPSGVDDENLFVVTTKISIDDYFAKNTYNCFPVSNNVGWKGPYMAAVNTDPWGNAYVINADQFNIDGGAVWVYSAGPNSVMESEAGAMTPNGDDIAIRIK